MSSLVIEIPDGTLLGLHTEPGRYAEELRLAAAVKLYEIGRLSSGAAAKLAGMPRCVFLTKIADYGVDTFQLAKADLERELNVG
ncbi:MAG: putative HTH domain antitoxin [Kiritimatiellia bacterium]|jgi:predicted HTH domain antitoxin